jgi:hypothetical protein
LCKGREYGVIGGERAQTDKINLPQSPFTGQFLRKADIKDWSLLVISSMSGWHLSKTYLSTGFYNLLTS